MKIKIAVHSDSKDNPESKVINVVEYDNIKGFLIEKISDDIMYEEFGEVDVDENGEYLIVIFENGDTSTFRYSHVDYEKE